MRGVLGDIAIIIVVFIFYTRFWPAKRGASFFYIFHKCRIWGVVLLICWQKSFSEISYFFVDEVVGVLGMIFNMF